MIIENPDTFKTWLTSILEPLCDADPAALAKYVYALVKKDKPLEELREGMLDQLDVFLQQETKPFVDMLFKALETNDYLKGELPAPASTDTSMEPEVPGEMHAIHDVSNGTSSLPERPPEPPRAADPPARPPQRVVKLTATARPLTEQTLVKVLPLNELLEEPVDQPPRRRDRRNDSGRDKDDRRRRRSRSWERRGRGRRPPEPHLDARARDKRRGPSRSPSPRRYRNRSPPAPALLDRPPSRSRSRSPVVARERPHERERIRPPRELERDRMSRDREHRDRLSRSRDRDRSRDRSRERSAGSPSRDALERDRPPLPPAFKRRCRDFDEKGYCMRGDLCQWDHGTDPLVLEDVLSMPPRVPEYNPLAPDIWSGPPVPPLPPGVPYPPHHHLPPPPRELIPIPRIRDVPPMPLHASIPPAPAPLRHQPPKNFDYNRLGPSRPPMGPNASNCSLEVKKVPRGLNDITHLNNHFSKFGKIVNIQVCFEGDPEAALITFSSHTEANVAYKSTEAVLNNRFIKVFWHNPESKQENVPPGANAGPGKQERVQGHQGHAGHQGSHNKVLINKDNMKQTADNKQAALAAAASEKAKDLSNGQEAAGKKETTKPAAEKTKQVMEMHRRAQSLLQTQLQQQVLLIHKLESGNVTGQQKAALLEAINSAQEGIEKLRKELVAYNKTLLQVQAKKTKSREEAQKEILDAELDMFTKQQEGQDVTELVKKIAELRRQMALQYPTHLSTRRPHPSAMYGRGGGGNRYQSGARFRGGAPAAPRVQAVDHRPRALLVSGFEPDELKQLLEHFAQFGEITGKEANLSVPELVVQFKARAQAEQAALKGRHYNERTLSITWVTGKSPLGPAPPASPVAATIASHGTDKPAEPTPELSEAALLRFDEEEEDEAEEDRTWRR